ncbi:hypothetical protein [Roseomonas elaeocarpi]|uniref:Uncharacterized protein n=1 Tax=Roseomonas elaeocarpi TaxID=907779 RepID=A0ABV6JP91_9PROT
MNRLIPALAAALLALPLAATAQPASDAAAPPPPPPPQTKFEHTDQSLEKLLSDGYEIRTSGGPFLFLGKPGALGAARWAACTIGLTGSMMADPNAIKTVPSTCFLMN